MRRLKLLLEKFSNAFWLLEALRTVLVAIDNSAGLVPVDDVLFALSCVHADDRVGQI